jgi:Holliday junction resolvase
MSAMSRRKGASHEREIVNLLKARGHDCARNLDQVRDGGGDIPFGEFLIECKRRKSIAIYEWWDQVNAACKDKNPALVIRADKRENLVVLRLDDFLDLVSRGPDSMKSDAPLPRGVQG